MDRPFLSFLTDFGPDGPAPICRGVMLTIAPDAQIVDIGHNVRKYAIRDGAFLLWCAVPYLPRGVHVAVVDPGVGTERRPVAIRARRGDVLVGPDNGLLMPATARLGGVQAAYVLENRDYWLPVTTSTFHGRDIFSPVAAHLAIGAPLESVGPQVDAASLVGLRFPEPVIQEGLLETSVLFVDSFGNARLAGEPADLEAALGPLIPGRRVVLEIDDGGARSVREPSSWQRTFGRVAAGESLLYEDSFGLLSLADNQGNVADRLSLVPDRRIRILAA